MENNRISEADKISGSSHKQERLWAILCHLSALLLFIVPPIGNILGPLIIWIFKRREMLRVDKEGKEALNFQISVSIYLFVSFVLCLLAVGFFLMVLILAADVVLVIAASIKVSKEEEFRYPCSIHFFK